MSAEADPSVRLPEGVDAFGRGEYEKARRIFSRIIETKLGVSELEEAQWYLARISEKEGKIEEARRQYLFFTKNFPSSLRLVEVRRRLEALGSQRGPSAPAMTGAPVRTKQPDPPPILRRKTARRDLLSGSLTTEYSYDRLLSPAPSISTQNRASEFLDLRWKKGEGADLKIYVSGMYSYDFLDREKGRSQISKVFADWTDSSGLYNVRFGRQPASGNTLFSRFDGLSVSYRPLSSIHLNAGGGYPVETFGTSNLKIQTDRRFYETYLTLFDFYRVGGKIYYTEEFSEAFSTRQAVGLNGYWMRDDVSVTTILDYDLDFREWNDELFSLEVTRSNIRYSGTVERRKNPFLDYTTALFDFSLIGNPTPVVTLRDLRDIKSRDEIQALALNNTSDSLEYRLGVTIDFSKVWRGDFRYARFFNEAVEIVGLSSQMVDKNSDRYSMFFSERNGLGFSEVWTLLLLSQRGTDYRTDSAASVLSKYWGAYGLGSLKARWERAEFKASASRSRRFVPGFALAFSLWGGVQTSLEGDYSIEKNSASPETFKTVQSRISVTVPF